MNDNDDEDKPVADVVAFSDYQKDPSQWPKMASDSPPEITVTKEEPKDRTILITLDQGEMVIEGHIGLTHSFLAIGDENGRVKFAAAPGKWQYVKDITDAVTDALHEEV